MRNEAWRYASVSSLPRFSLTGSQKPIKITRIKLKQQREAHKAGAETLHVYIYEPIRSHTIHQIFPFFYPVPEQILSCPTQH